MQANKHNRCNRANRAAFVIGCVSVLAATFIVTSDLALARVGVGPHPIVMPGFNYEGAASCSGSGCHSEPEPTEQSGQWIGNEVDIWAQWDPHAKGFKTLGNDESKAIADKLNIADAAASDRCLTCHAVAAPPEQQGQLFSHADDAVSCEACHGPGEKWLDPHAKEGWTPQQRTAIGAEGLLKDFGLVDTSRIDIRANTCVACHLQIDKDMIDAGHPPLEFELYAYNYYISKNPDAEYYRHWDEATGRQIDARLWATGQAAALEAAQAQVKDWQAKGWDTADAEKLVKLYTIGVDVAEKHFGSRTTAGLAQAQYTAPAMAGAAKDLAAKAGEATNAIEARVIGFGVSALGAASFQAKGEEVPAAFWDHYQDAIAGQPGDTLVNATKAMADIANQ